MIEFFSQDVGTLLVFACKKKTGGGAFNLTGFTAYLYCDKAQGSPLTLQVTNPATGIATYQVAEAGQFDVGEYNAQVVVKLDAQVFRAYEVPFHVMDSPLSPVNP